MIGFHPEDSVVLLTFGTDRLSEGRAVAGPDAFQARIDLPVTEHEQRAVASMLREVVARHRIQVTALVLYSEDAEVASSFADLLVPDLLEDGVEVIDVLRTDGERYYSVADADDPGVAFDLRSHPLTAAGVWHGRVVHDSRNALRDTLIGTDAAAIQAVADAADGFMDGLVDDGLTAESAPEVFAALGRWLQSTVAEHLSDPDLLSDEEAGRLLVLLALDPLREVAWSALERGNASAYVEFLRALIRRTPPELLPGVASLLGLAAWLAGDGALAWCALDRCLAARPDDHLAHHVAALLESATPPSVWAPLPADGLPIFAGRPQSQPGSGEDSPLGSVHGAGCRGAGVQPG